MFAIRSQGRKNTSLDAEESKWEVRTQNCERLNDITPLGAGFFPDHLKRQFFVAEGGSKI
jgi:hypothetical protein